MKHLLLTFLLTSTIFLSKAEDVIVWQTRYCKTYQAKKITTRRNTENLGILIKENNMGINVVLMSEDGFVIDNVTVEEKGQTSEGAFLYEVVYHAEATNPSIHEIATPRPLLDIAAEPYRKEAISYLHYDRDGNYVKSEVYIF